MFPDLDPSHAMIGFHGFPGRVGRAGGEGLGGEGSRRGGDRRGGEGAEQPRW